MRKNQILRLFIGVSLFCALPGRAQESRPGSKQPNSSTVTGILSQETQAAAAMKLGLRCARPDFLGRRMPLLLWLMANRTFSTPWANLFNGGAV
jgi:hypothetical protein